MSRKDKKVRIFSALEVANICGVVNQTAINWIKNNHLKAFTTPGGQYRVYAEDLLDFLQNRGMRIPDELSTLVPQQTAADLLIIDDDESLNNMIKDYLGRKVTDVTIHQAFDGFEAGKLISEKRPTMVILDIGLPGVNGFKLCRSIKNDPEHSGIKVISISGLNSQEDENQIMREGADMFFPKPLDFPKLLEAVQQLLVG